MTRSRAGVRHLMSNPVIAALAADSRLIAMATDWLGATTQPFRATLFEKTSQSNWLIPWHQDTALPLESKFDEPGWGPWSEKAGVHYAHAPAWALSRVIALRVHLDASTAENGSLRGRAGLRKTSPARGLPRASRRSHCDATFAHPFVIEGAERRSTPRDAY